MGGEEGAGVSQWPELDVPTAQGLTAQQRWEAARRGVESHPSQRLPTSMGRGLSPSSLSPFRPFQPVHHLARRLLACGCGFPRPSALGGLAGMGVCAEMSHTQKSFLSVFP